MPYQGLSESTLTNQSSQQLVQGVGHEQMAVMPSDNPDKSDTSSCIECSSPGLDITLGVSVLVPNVKGHAESSEKPLTSTFRIDELHAIVGGTPPSPKPVPALTPNAAAAQAILTGQVSCEQLGSKRSMEWNAAEMQAVLTGQASPCISSHSYSNGVVRDMSQFTGGQPFSSMCSPVSKPRPLDQAAHAAHDPHTSSTVTSSAATLATVLEGSASTELPQVPSSPPGQPSSPTASGAHAVEVDPKPASTTPLKPPGSPHLSPTKLVVVPHEHSFEPAQPSLVNQDRIVTISLTPPGAAPVTGAYRAAQYEEYGRQYKLYREGHIDESPSMSAIAERMAEDEAVPLMGPKTPGSVVSDRSSNCQSRRAGYDPAFHMHAQRTPPSATSSGAQHRHPSHNPPTTPLIRVREEPNPPPNPYGGCHVVHVQHLCCQTRHIASGCCFVVFYCGLIVCHDLHHLDIIFIAAFVAHSGFANLTNQHSVRDSNVSGRSRAGEASARRHASNRHNMPYGGHATNRNTSARLALSTGLNSSTSSITSQASRLSAFQDFRPRWR